MAVTVAAGVAVLALILIPRAHSSVSLPANGGGPALAGHRHGRGRGVRIGTPPGIYWGATIASKLGQAPWNMALADSFARLAGKPLSIISWGSPFYSAQGCAGYCSFQTTEFDAVRGYGAIPMLSWAPNAERNVDQQIADGAEDSYLTQWAQAAKAWGHPFFLRFAWEMNGGWFPWGVSGSGVSTLGNTPASYKAMWRHVYDIFERVGATNVTWVWCPNVDAPTTYKPLSNLYPGNRYVDWTCLDGYNGDNPWRSFASLYSQAYNEVSHFAPDKPIMDGEVSSTGDGGSKSQWVTSMFTTLPALFPRIRAFVWYEANDPGPGGRSDWTIDTTRSALHSFREGIASSAYKGNAFSTLSASPIRPPS